MYSRSWNKMKLNAAVIGAGIMGKNHARVYSKLGNVNLVAVCDSDKENGKKIAEMHNARFYANHKEMIEKEELDAVSVCVPTVYHKDVAIDVLRKKRSEEHTSELQSQFHLVC